MAFISYSEKLQNPLWQKKRLEILDRDHFTCTICGDKETTLHIHHKEYIKGNEPWEYQDDNFQTLCKHCHLVTEYFKSKQEVILVGRKINYESDYQSFFVITKCLVMGERNFYSFFLQGNEVEITKSFSQFEFHAFTALLTYIK